MKFIQPKEVVKMGWWEIKDNSDMYNGDGPADILGEAFDKVIKEYEKEWDRKPYYKELIAAVHFVLGGKDWLEEKTDE